MTVTPIQFLIVCPLVFLAGLIDAIAGGGGLISLPAYLIAGLPSHAALGTNKLGNAMGTTLTTIRFAKQGYIHLKTAIPCIIVALCGSSVGASAALLIDDRIFRIIMLVLLPLTALYIMKGKAFREEKHPFALKKTVLLCCAISAVLGFYDGFYGPGTGTFLILLLSGIAHLKLNDSAGLTKAINLSTNYAALAVFLRGGVVVLSLGITAGCFSIAGNYIGTVCFNKGGVKFVKPVMLIVLALFLIKVIRELVLGA